MDRWIERYPDGVQPISDRATVLPFVIAELQRAGKRVKYDPKTGHVSGTPDPLSKADLHTAMCTKFPERDPRKMYNYLSNLVPFRLKDERGVWCWKGLTKEDTPKLGFFVVGAGEDPQPKEIENEMMGRNRKPGGGRRAAATAEK